MRESIANEWLYGPTPIHKLAGMSIGEFNKDLVSRNGLDFIRYLEIYPDRRLDVSNYHGKVLSIFCAKTGPISKYTDTPEKFPEFLDWRDGEKFFEYSHRIGSDIFEKIALSFAKEERERLGGKVLEQSDRSSNDTKSKPEGKVNEKDKAESKSNNKADKSAESDKTDKSNNTKENHEIGSSAVETKQKRTPAEAAFGPQNMQPINPTTAMRHLLPTIYSGDNRKVKPITPLNINSEIEKLLPLGYTHSISRGVPGWHPKIYYVSVSYHGTADIEKSFLVDFDGDWLTKEPKIIWRPDQFRCQYYPLNTESVGCLLAGSKPMPLYTHELCAGVEWNGISSRVNEVNERLTSDLYSKPQLFQRFMSEVNNGQKMRFINVLDGEYFALRSKTTRYGFRYNGKVRIEDLSANNTKNAKPNNKQPKPKQDDKKPKTEEAVQTPAE